MYIYICIKYKYIHNPNLESRYAPSEALVTKGEPSFARGGVYMQNACIMYVHGVYMYTMCTYN